MKKDLTPQTSFRNNCPRCLRPNFYCYCRLIAKIDSKIKFVILIHPIEARRKIATGRMAHLCLENSLLIKGDDFTHNKEVNQLIQNSKNYCLLLYPGKKAINLSEVDFSKEISARISNEKEIIIFVIDGTWSTAKKTMRLSENLKALPTICFTPTIPSQFRIRKQPAAHCYSTIEAIYSILNFLEGPKNGESSHTILMTVFQRMVEQQLKYIP